jgi:hypothetical protein
MGDKKIMNNTRGETLLEGIVSILIFSVLIATITMTLMTAFRITSNSFEEGTRRQNLANTMLGHTPLETDTLEFAVTIDGEWADMDFNISIRKESDDDLQFFTTFEMPPAP